MFSELDEYLKSKFSPDYWSDEGISLAEQKISEFSENDWLELKKAILARESKWLVRCAEALGDVESLAAVDVLMDLVMNSDVEVQVSSLDSLNAQLDRIDFGEKTMEKLRKVVDSFESSSEVVNTMLSSLRSKVL